MASYEWYSRFYTEEDATILTGLLDQHAIPYTVEKEVNQLDNIYLGESLDPMFVVKLPRNQFAQVTALLSEQAKADFQTPGFTHYLSSYEIPELEDIVRHPNDWNGYDVQVAELLLQQQQAAIAGSQSSLKFITSYKPEQIDTKWLVLGYLLCFLSILGIFFGLSITQAKKNLQSGESVHIYDTASIRHGNIMIAIGAVFTVLLVLSRMLR